MNAEKKQHRLARRFQPGHNFGRKGQRMRFHFTEQTVDDVPGETEDMSSFEAFPALEILSCLTVRQYLDITEAEAE